MTNIILDTDSYKLNHWNQYPKDTETVYSYFESRDGAKFPYTVFFGLQSILKRYLEGAVVSWEDIDVAHRLATPHFGSSTFFNYQGWSHIIEEHKGKLPLRIKAVPEGTVVPTGNVLMTVENTCPRCFWLTNAVESLLTHAWYPSTVATLSRSVKEVIVEAMNKTADPEALAAVPFMLHDFGYRGASSHESAEIGGAAHLVNFVGTDTLPAILLAHEHYEADFATTGFSVAATEHSVMTALGREGEFEVVNQLLDDYPAGILSVVADSYNIYNFVTKIGTDFKDRILEREGVFVVRPDSVTKSHPNPEDLVVWISHELAQRFGTTINSRGYKVINPKVRILWGDGIDIDGVRKILAALAKDGFSAENMAAFGMGGGLLQKVDRDTQRFAFKSSAQERSGVWYDIFKDPIDSTKASKKGRLQLSVTDPYPGSDNIYETSPLGFHHDHMCQMDILQTVFENGELFNTTTFEEVRDRAKL